MLQSFAHALQKPLARTLQKPIFSLFRGGRQSRAGATYGVPSLRLQPSLVARTLTAPFIEGYAVVRAAGSGERAAARRVSARRAPLRGRGRAGPAALRHNPRSEAGPLRLRLRTWRARSKAMSRGRERCTSRRTSCALAICRDLGWCRDGERSSRRDERGDAAHTILRTARRGCRRGPQSLQRWLP